MEKEYSGKKCECGGDRVYVKRDIGPEGYPDITVIEVCEDCGKSYSDE